MSWDPQYRRQPSFGGRFSLFPPGMKFLLLANAGVYLFQIFFGQFHLGPSGKLGDVIEMYFPLWPIDSGMFRPWQFLTYMYMHAGFTHILMNMFVLWMFGSEIEQMWGTKKFLIYYTACGLGGGLAHLILSSVLGLPTGPLVGASGAIFGIMIAYWFMFPDRYIMLYFLVPIRTKYLIPGFIAIEVYSLWGGSADNVAHLAHIGGAITGLIYLLVSSGGRMMAARRSQPGNFWQNPRARNGDMGGGLFGSRAPFRGGVRNRAGAVDAEYHDVEHGQEPTQTTGDVKQARVITQDEIDRILDKIAATGYQNLTEEEREILFEASRRMEERR